jgi:hypothetical protein
MRRTLIAASLLLAVLGPVAATAPAHGHDADKGCNLRPKGLKTLSDPQRKLVNLHPKNSTAGGDQRPAAASPDAEDTPDGLQSAGLAGHGADHRVQA